MIKVEELILREGNNLKAGHYTTIFLGIKNNSIHTFLHTIINSKFDDLVDIAKLS